MSSVSGSGPSIEGDRRPEQLLNCPTGSYEYYFDTGELRWSDEMYRIHGYRRGEMVPSLESGFPYVPAEEQEGVRALWGRLLTDGGPIAGYHTVIDRRGRRHRVLSVGDLIVDAGSVVGVRGMVTDLTEPVDRNTRRATAQAVADSARNRAVIEQAKGILMGRHKFSADEAFEALSARSQAVNRRVADLAQDIVDTATGQTASSTLWETPSH